MPGRQELTSIDLSSRIRVSFHSHHPHSITPESHVCMQFFERSVSVTANSCLIRDVCLVDAQLTAHTPAKILKQLSSTGGVEIDIQVKGKDEASNRELSVRAKVAISDGFPTQRSSLI